MRQDESIALSQQQGLPPRRPPSWALRNAAWMAVSVTLLVTGALALVLHGDGTSPGGALRQSLQAQQMWMFAGATLLVMACFAAARTDLRRPARAMPCHPATAPPDAAAELARPRFAAAIESLTQGIVILDPDYRLVINNRRLYDFYPPSGAPFAPGTALHDIIARNVAAGHHPGHTAAELSAAMDHLLAIGEPFDFRHDLPSGHIVKAQWHRLPDGGWCGTYEDITERHHSVARIAHMTRHDELTGIFNRAGFGEALERALARARRGEDFAVLTINIDRFKKVIDSFGHATADALLLEATARLRRSVREVDDIGRLGSEEFAIVQAGVEQPGASEALARRITEVIAVPFAIDGQEISVGASIGIARGTAAAEDAVSLLRNAALALTCAKDEGAKPGGRGSWCFFADEMHAAARERRALEMDLRQALDRNEFILFYQPLINIGERRVSAFEALLRWRHPERGIIPPDAFIPLAEETGLIVPIGEWVLRTACAEAMRWDSHDTGTPLRVAVNLSAVQFSSPGLADAVEQALAGSGLPGHRLELEVTESVLLQDNQATLDMLHRLRKLGARISMDDFGTGYSSLSYLRSFPFDKIKIDKSFIHDLNESDENGAIVRAIAGLGISLGIATTAEGVETLAQLETLIADGCTEVQGYFFSPPRPAAEVPALILNSPSKRDAA